MAVVLLIEDERLLEGFLRNFPSDKTTKKFLALRECTAKTLAFLAEHGFAPVEKNPYPTAYRERFLREYVDVVGALNCELASRYWWATDISSKNRFTSKLSFSLQQFLSAMEVAKSHKQGNLLIINVPWNLLPSLKRALAQEGIAFDALEIRWKKSFDLTAGWLRRLAATLADFGRMFLRYLAARELRTQLEREGKSKTSYYLIKTFVYNHSFSVDGKYRDMFFGRLPDFIKEEKKNVLFLAYVIGDFKNAVRRMKACSSDFIIPVEALWSLRDIVKGCVTALFYRTSYAKEHNFFGYEIRDLVNAELQRTFCRIQPYQLLHYEAARRLLKKISVETFLFTYENNPWEKMCLLAFCHDSPQTRTIGYQHTIVTQASANMFASRREADVLPRPQTILTVGEIPKEIIARYSPGRQAMMEAAGGVRFEYLFPMTTAKRRPLRNILIMLEGVSEVYKMVNYVLEGLKDDRKFEVVIRLHPELSLKRLKSKLKYPVETLPNRSFSKNVSIKDDIEWADAVIYWGSTGALEALCVGKPIINFDAGSVLSYDPLFECQHLKWNVSSQSSLKFVFEEIQNLSDDQYLSLQRQAKAYLSRYFFPVTPDALKKFIPKKES